MSPDAILIQFAASANGDSDLLTTLGIDWTMLAMQIIAFLVLMAILGKFVYPVFMRIIDERQAKIDASVKAAEVAQQKAEEAEDHVAKELRAARKEAASIVATAKDEANSMIAKASEKAKANADHLLEVSREEIAKETAAAKKALHNETIDLVALATEKVIGSKLDAKTDKAVIKKALEEIK